MTDVSKQLLMIITRVSTEEEVAEIKALQSKNLFNNLNETERYREGFLTAEYSLQYLREMNHIQGAVIAKVNNKVEGYVLVVERGIATKHPLLKDLCNQIDKCYFNSTGLNNESYVVVGQLCVGKNHRGKGVVGKMYNLFQKELSKQYKYCITDVDTDNPRSVKAHLNVGFEIIGSLNFGGKKWHIVLWDWNKK